MIERLRYPEVAPEGVGLLARFGHYLTTETSLEPTLKALIELRVSQMNGCEFCTAMHSNELRKHHEPESRIEAVAVWAGSDAFTPREKAALAWAESLTRLGTEGVMDDQYAAAQEYFTGKDLVDLTLTVANINAWNRLGIAFRPAWDPKKGDRSAIGDDGNKIAED